MSARKVSCTPAPDCEESTSGVRFAARCSLAQTLDLRPEPLVLCCERRPARLRATRSLDGLSGLRPGEFLLTVKNPRRLVPRAVFVPARIPSPGRDSEPAAAGT